jgi:D-tyrosyl-tRNA(Tyr) deacylase
MKIVIQRVTSASILINSEIKRNISKGLVVYFGISKEDSIEKIDYFVNKIITLRVWGNEEKGFQSNIVDIKGELLIVSQFTLYGDCTQGTKPKFNDAMNPIEAKEIYDLFVSKLRSKCDLKIETGEFGSHMEITQVNNGPMTMIVER